jgi:hypothetical protein|tara:strand:- start:337 stop:507 length:171 start_codon:yes stop_codon:yes gene_type:complete
MSSGISGAVASSAVVHRDVTELKASQSLDELVQLCSDTGEIKLSISQCKHRLFDMF